MIKIPLTQDKDALVDDDAARLLKFTWHARRRRHTCYAATNVGAYTVYMHRLVLVGAKEIDHQNGNGLDNQLRNLRPATRSQNMANRGAQTNNTSGFKGVVWEGRRKMWQARIEQKGRNHHLGYFSTPEVAARAYDIAASACFGAFASLNFSQNTETKNN